MTDESGDLLWALERAVRWLNVLAEDGPDLRVNAHLKVAHEAQELAANPTREEWADVAICLVGTVLGQRWTLPQLTAAVSAKVAVNAQRTWVQQHDGTWQHNSSAPPDQEIATCDPVDSQVEDIEATLIHEHLASEESVECSDDCGACAALELIKDLRNSLDAYRKEASDSTADNLVALSKWIDAGNAHRDIEAVTWGRLAKITEEAGEVIQAYIGYTGQNPRKGRTHRRSDVVAELLDVAVTALGAVEHMGGHQGLSLLALEDKINALADRAGVRTGHLASGQDAEQTEEKVVHWIGEGPTWLHGGKGAGTFAGGSGDEDEVTCTLCQTLLSRGEHLRTLPGKRGS